MFRPQNERVTEPLKETSFLSMGPIIPQPIEELKKLDTEACFSFLRMCNRKEEEKIHLEQTKQLAECNIEITFKYLIHDASKGFVNN